MIDRSERVYFARCVGPLGPIGAIKIGCSHRWNERVKELAVQVKRDRSNVLRWRKGETRPDFEALLAIEEITKGKVTARDFAEAGK